MRVLVTGGNRYIGLALVFELARQGHDVTVVNSHEAALPDGARRIHADRTAPGALLEALGPVRDEFDAVFDNTAYRPADLDPMVELFAGRVRHFVFTSSVAVYRRSYVQPVHEGSATHSASDEDPRKAYGVGKVQSERFVLAQDGLPATCLRVTHTIGPNSPLVTREPSFFRRLELGVPIRIPGEGFPIVHLVHVQDVARLMCSVLGNDAAAGQTYNVAGAELTSVLGCVRLMAKVMGVEAEVEHVPMEEARAARPPLVHWGEALVGSAVFSIDKARRELDWSPSFGLEAAYRDSWEWFDREGRDRFTYDLAQVGSRQRRPSARRSSAASSGPHEPCS